MEKTKRMSNLDLYRCVAMMFVVVLHYLGKGDILQPVESAELTAVSVTARILETFAIVAVNSYMLLSGYFLVESGFKLRKLIGLVLQVWSFSVAFGVIGPLLGMLREANLDTHYVLTILFPVTMVHYWFMTAYVILFAMLPFILPTIKKMDKNHFRVAIWVVLIIFSVLKTVVPFRLESDAKGYDALWYFCMFLVGAYIRRFGLKSINTMKKSLIIYFVSVALILCEAFIFRAVNLKTGSLSFIISYMYEYNHFLVVLETIGLFGIFQNMTLPEKAGDCISRIAPYSLGVYLFHENIGVRYGWEMRLFAYRVTNPANLIAFMLIAVLVLFVMGVCFDWLRKKIFDFLHKWLCHVRFYKKIYGSVLRIDEGFGEI
ncbi:MAG: acyltransferase [Lachnospiraceae bacterium]|nr:acyltransferase [Lachnospiraceae bacterium]